MVCQRLRYVVGAGIALIAMGGCREARGETDPLVASTRTRVAAKWSVAWRASARSGKLPSTTTLRVRYGAGKLFAVDPTAGTATLLRARDGAMLWTTAKLATDSRVQNPRDAVFLSDQRILVADMNQKALVLYDSTGHVTKRIVISPAVQSMCVVGAKVLMYTWSAKQPIWLFDVDQETKVRSDLPWPELVGAMPDKASGSFQETPDGCVYTRQYGSGFARWSDGRFVGTSAFVERPAPATASDRSPFSALAGTVVGSELFVLYEGATHERRQLIDVYALASGKYLRTLLAPESLIWLTYADGMFYGVTSTADAREIIAFREVR